MGREACTDSLTWLEAVAVVGGGAVILLTFLIAVAGILIILGSWGSDTTKGEPT